MSTPNSTLDIALRIKADLDSARQQVSGLRTEVQGLGTTSSASLAALQQVNAQLDALIGLTRDGNAQLQSRRDAMTSATAATQEAAAATQSLTRATQEQAETEDQAIQRIRDMVRASQELSSTQRSAATSTVASGVTTATAGASSVTAAEASAFNAATQACVAALQELNVAFAGNLATEEGMAAAEAALDVAMAKGAVSAQEQKVYLERLNAAVAASTVVLEADTVAQGENAAATAANSATKRELGVIIGELARGNTARLEGSLVTLANRSGFLSTVLSPLGLTIGGVATELGLFAVEAEKAAEQQNKFNAAIEKSGNFAGVTAAGLEQMSQQIARTPEQLGDARVALETLVASGRVGSGALTSMGQAAVDMAQLTGESADKAANAVVHMFDGTVQSVVKANDQYHFLTTAIYDQITAYEKEGDTQAAMETAAQAFHQAMQQRLEDEQQNVRGLGRVWDELKSKIEGTLQAIRQTSSILTGTADDQTELYYLQGRKAQAQNGELTGWGKLLSMIGDTPDAKDALAREQWTPEDEKKLQDLQQKIASDQQQAQLKGANQQLATGAVDAAADLDKLSNSLDKTSAKQRALNELNSDFLKLWKGAEPNDPRLKGVQAITDDSGNTTFSGGLYDQLKTDIDKRYSPRNSGEQRAQNTAVAAQQQLIKLLADEQGAISPVAKVWAQYNDNVEKANELATKAKTAHGANVQAIEAERQALVQEYAAARDADLAKLADKDREAFEKLMQSLSDANGVKLDKLQAQIAQITKDLNNGVISAKEFDDAFGKIVDANTKKLPTYKGIGSAVGGPFGELDKIAQFQQGLDTDYESKQRANADAYQQSYGKATTQDTQLAATESFLKKENELYQEYYGKLNDLDHARQQVMLTGLTQSFSEAANIIGQGFGKQSEAYRLAFSLAKAAAIAQAGVNMWSDISQASAKGWPANIPLIAQATAEGLSIIGNLRAIETGFDQGGYTGPGGKNQIAGVVHAGEVVHRQEVVNQPGALPFLLDFNQRGMAALHDYASALNGYASGGLVGAPSVPAPPPSGISATRLPATSVASAAVAPSVKLRNINLIDRDLVLDIMRSSDGANVTLNHIDRHATRVRQSIGS
jgi:phage-related minor tail protein